jgi:O-acetyl-ADP-ribose deacetylase (regulator of RNase III)
MQTHTAVAARWLSHRGCGSDKRRTSQGEKGDPYALNIGIKTISFPSISTGAYGYPVEKASRVALRAIVDFLGENERIAEVRFVLHSRNDLGVYEEALEEIVR